MSALQGLALEHAVDETLHLLLPRYERLLRRRFHLGLRKATARIRHLHPKRPEVAALRALRRLTLSPRRNHSIS